MKEKIAKLIDLKSIITFMTVTSLIVFTWKGLISSEVFAGLASAVTTYYFTKKDKEEV